MLPITVQYRTQHSTWKNGVRQHVVKHAANCLSERALTSLDLVLPPSTRFGVIPIALSKRVFTSFRFRFRFSLFSWDPTPIAFALL